MDSIRTTSMRPAIPAAVSRCPMFDVAEPIRTDPAPLGVRAERLRRGCRFDLVAEGDSGAVISR